MVSESHGMLALSRECWILKNSENLHKKLENKLCLWNMNMYPGQGQWSQIKVKITGQNYLYEWEALVTRNLRAKYEGSIWNSSKVMTYVTFFF